MARARRRAGGKAAGPLLRAFGCRTLVWTSIAGTPIPQLPLLVSTTPEN
jgi:hypothetical protein